MLRPVVSPAVVLPGSGARPHTLRER